MTTKSTVFIVDDDTAARNSLCELVRSVGLGAEAFASAEEFLKGYDSSRPGCAVFDVYMPGMTGLQLQQRLVDEGVALPIILMTGQANVPMAVDALKRGAVDFLEKPYRAHELLDRIQQAIMLDLKQRATAAQCQNLAELFARLTPREREVLELVVAGEPNKSIATSFGISQRTIEIHRSRVMEKLEVFSVQELVQLTLEYRRVSENRDPST